jgi:hypothetical protein
MSLINKKVCRGIGILILLTLYLGLCFEAAALDEMAVGDFHELEGGYSITVEEADVESGKAIFLLLKEDRVVDETVVNPGEWFRLHDEEIFYFEAILDSVFRREEMIMLHLVDYNWEWVEPPYEEPQEERVEPPYEEPPYAILYSILIVSAAVIVLIFVVFKSINLKDRIRQQKIEEYRAKMEEWEKEGYNVSELKEVLEGKK